MFSRIDMLYSGFLFLILLPFSYFLVLLAQHIFLRVIMFRRINLDKMSKHQAALFDDERKTTLRAEFLWLIVFALTLEYANMLIQRLTGNQISAWTARELTGKSLLCLYLWGFLLWYDYHRWKDRIRTGRREIFVHCRYYLATLWFLVAIIFLLLSA